MENIKNFNKLFLEQSQEDTWDYYCKSINDTNMAKWDWIVLTASNKEQADVYQNEIDYRLKRNLLPKATKYAVIPDPEGKRVGSGGATLNVLKYIHENLEKGETFKNQKILVIHSGGDSKRVPQYSAIGKLFSPVQRELPDGRPSTLFDEFIITFSAVPARMAPGMLVLSGDVLLVFNPLQVDLTYLESACISIKAPVEIGTNHGVFLADENNVKQFLHKLPIETLKQIGATNDNNFVNIDTGAIYLNNEMVEKLFSLISTNSKIDINKFNEFVNEKARISFYGDFVYPLAEDSSIENYKIQAPEGEMCEELLKCREKIWEILSKYNMRIIKLSPAEFIHFGTTKELQELVSTEVKKYECLGWERKVLCNLPNEAEYSVNNAYISDDSIIEKDAYIENSYIGHNCKIGSNTIISNTKIENLNIPANVCINTLILDKNKYVTRIYSIKDNPKIVKKENTPFLNTTLEKALVKYKISENQIWDNKEHSIWRANLYCICNSQKESIESAMLLYDIIHCKATQEETEKYFSEERTSLYESFNKCNTMQMKIEREQIEVKVRTEQIIRLIQEKTPANIVVEKVKKSPNLEKQIDDILEKIREIPTENRYKMYLMLSLLLKQINVSKYSDVNFEELCYAEIKNMITVHTANNKVKTFSSNVDVSLPIRINFGGGWSDTPPFCNENGGSVLNGAFKLNGDNPVKVHLEKIEQNSIILESKDLNIKKEFTNIEELKNCANTNDVFALHKASLLITGVVQQEDKNIQDVIKRIGKGLYFSTHVKNIPKGSGLGTSSILAGACIKALYKFMNIPITDEDLCYKALEQEQLMGTGGGWQDQIGGVVPGIKLTTTEPGYIQKFNIKPIKLTPQFKEKINNRLALIYTGQRRLAKNLLRSIMNKVVYNDPETIDTINKIKETSKEMTKVLQEENIDKFAELLNKHWELSRKIDKGCTNTIINQIFVACDDLIIGKMICGAGGGGFLQVILKENVSKEVLSKRINEVFQDSGIKVYDVTLD